MSTIINSSRNMDKTMLYLPNIFLALRRDNYTCQVCGSNRLFSRLGRRILIVHHKDNSRKTGNLNNNLENLITLCKKCHAKAHQNDKSNTARERRIVRILEMRQNGFTCAEIGKKLKISRQRVHWISKNNNPTS